MAKTRYPTLSLMVATTVALAMTAGTALVHGRLTNRWGQPEGMLAAVARVDAFPRQIGEWQAEDSSELSSGTVEMLQCQGYMQRNYTHQKTQETVSVALLVGPPGPMSVHTPEVCYPRRNFQITKDPERLSLAGDDQIWGITLRSPQLDARTLRVYYAWTDGKQWEAPDEPRLAFAGRDYLLKIQLASYVEARSAAAQSDPCLKFLHDAMPTLNQALGRSESTK